MDITEFTVLFDWFTAFLSVIPSYFLGWFIGGISTLITVAIVMAFIRRV